MPFNPHAYTTLDILQVSDQHNATCFARQTDVCASENHSDDMDVFRSSALQDHAASYCAGGDLRLVSMPGYGVDTYLSIQYLEGRWEESRVEPHTDAVSQSGSAVALP